MLQFPLSFEFNDHFLSTIAYHHVSMRFRTFLLDSEHERMESGWMVEEDGKPRGKSLWDYMDFQKSRSPLYNNFLYSPGQHKVGHFAQKSAMMHDHLLFTCGKQEKQIFLEIKKGKTDRSVFPWEEGEALCPFLFLALFVLD